MGDAIIGQPSGIRSVWDNGGRSADRYTVVTDEDMGKGLWAMLGMSDAPEHGFSQWGECTEGSHLGRRVRWDDLPQDVREHAARRFAED
jgi:hypothetical protein